MTGNRSFEDRGSTSPSLLDGAKRSLPASWERLVRLYAPLVATWCRRWSVAEQDIADILQDVFSAVAGSLQRFHKDRPADTFRGWLLTIARNKVRDHYRRRAAEPDAAGGTAAARWLEQIPAASEACDAPLPGTPLMENALPDGLLPDDALPDDLLPDDLLRKALASIRNDFQERTWRAFWGVVVEGRLAADVAADLGMQPGTVRVAKSRVLLRLRRELGDLPG